MTADSPEVRRRSVLAHGLLIAVTLVWGSTFPLVKAALSQVSPLLFNTLRMLLAAALLLLVNRRHLRGLSVRQIRSCAVAGVLLAAGYELQTSGLARTTPSKSALLTGLVVVLVPFLSLVPGLHLKGAPKPHLAAYLGAASAFVGIALLTSDPAAGYALLAGMRLGEWLTLGCALAFAVHLLTLARVAHTVSPRVLGTLQIAFAALTMLPLLGLERGPRLHWTPIVVAALLVTAILATAAAFTIQSWAQQFLPPTHTALIFTLEPVFALLTSLLFLHERLTARATVGAGLILLGILIAEVGPTALSQAGILPVDP